jgi:hypothetical protein
MNHSNTRGLMTKQTYKKFAEMLVALGDSLSHLASSDDVEHGEEEDEEIGPGEMRENYKPGWMIITITKMVRQRMQRFLQ